MSGERNEGAGRAPLDELAATLLTESELGFVSFDGDGSVTYANAEVLARYGTVPAAWSQDALQALRTRRRLERTRDEVRVLFVPPSDGSQNVVAIISEAASDAVSRATNERVAALGRIAAGVAHEVSNPLTYVYGNLELAMHELEAVLTRDPSQKRRLQPVLDLLGEAVDGAERIRNVLADIGLLARGDASAHGGNRADLREVATSALRMIGATVRASAELHLELGPAPLVSGSAARLAQVIVNLLTNALDALPARPSDANHIALTVAKAGSDACITVVDNGVGIPPSMLARVFDPFFTTTPVGRGVGLGLAITHAIVTSFGGRIDITSEVDVGTTVTVLLPGLADATVD